MNIKDRTRKQDKNTPNKNEKETPNTQNKNQNQQTKNPRAHPAQRRATIAWRVRGECVESAWKWTHRLESAWRVRGECVEGAWSLQTT